MCISVPKSAVWPQFEKVWLFFLEMMRNATEIISYQENATVTFKLFFYSKLSLLSNCCI